MVADTPIIKRRLWKDWLYAVVRWYHQRQLAKAKKALAHMLITKDPEIYRELGQCAHALATQLCMQWLDRRRINHCLKCPQTEQLLALNGGYVCPNHGQKVAKEVARV